MPRLPAVAVLALLAASPVEAQNSVFGVLGIGFPSRAGSVRSRAMGDGGAVVDPLSAVNPAAPGSLQRLTVAAASIQEFRNVSFGGTETGGLRETRFPYARVAGRFGVSSLGYSLGFSQYAERSFDVSTIDTLVLRGAPVEVTDRVAASGGIVDLRAALAMAANPTMNVGLGLHVLSGSSRITTQRQFSDSAFRRFSETVDASYSGFAISAGMVATPAPGIRLGASARYNTRLERSVGDRTTDRITLPFTVTGGAELDLSPAVRVAASAGWQSWAGAGDDLTVGTAFNTWEAGAGIEIGGEGAPLVPLRLGVRYATLPFSGTADQPHELDFSAGTGIVIAGGRARIAGTVERVMRDGGGVSERAWQIVAGFQVSP